MEKISQLPCNFHDIGKLKNVHKIYTVDEDGEFTRGIILFFIIKSPIIFFL